ncbi:MAG: hypothetical protein ACM3U1_07485 [Chloroflexota bacterium]
MAQIGNGYGSEWHMLRFLGYHRQYLIHKILSEVPAFQNRDFRWIDQNFSTKNELHSQDCEHKDIEIYYDKKLNEAWKAYWPQSGNSQNWDAIARITVEGKTEYVFVEAKAHTEELKSSCGAKSSESVEKIKIACKETQKYFELNHVNSALWLQTYYQFANRLAFLHFLLKNDVKAHLLFIYFYGDKNEKGNCPDTKAGWDESLEKMYSHFGVSSESFKSDFNNRVHKVFVPTNPNVLD